MIAILDKAGRPDEQLARRMLAAAPHRGSCVRLRVIGNCVLGIANRRDFVDAALSADGALVAALSGRLDNSTELRAELTSTGFPPAAGSDADVVVAAFRAFGDDAPNRMRGAFAGIVSDGTRLRCFRDHVGFRPLFYRDDARAVTAASEARQVVVGAGIPEEPDLDVLTRILYERMPADTPAALKGVARLPQATLLSAGPDGTVTRRYWHPFALLETARLRPRDVRDRFIELLDRAVRRTMTGRDAVLLSGGLDSPAVAAFAAPAHRQRTGRPIGALSAVFPDLPSVDERHYIEIVASHFGIELHTYRPQSRALDDVDKWSRLFGTPVPIVSVPEIADNHVRARQLGYDNLLTGDFAEFTFGNPMHLPAHLLTRFRWRALSRLVLAEHRRGGSRRALAREMIATFVPGRLANSYLRWRRLDVPERIPDWLDRKRINEVPYRSDLLPPPHRRWLMAQHSGLEGSTITMEADEICGAIAGVTIRRPFADIDLWEFFLGLPAEIKCPDLRFKNLARGMLRGVLPDAILDRRRKTYFDDHSLTQIDYPTLRRLLVNPRHRVPGVDYERLARRIDRQDFNRFDWTWARDLAGIHAFLGAW